MLAELLFASAVAGDALYGAVVAGDAAGVTRALAAGERPADVHATTIQPNKIGRFFGARARESYDTALHEAVRRAVSDGPRAEAILDALIAASDGVDVVTADVGTPLALAVGAAPASTRAEAVARKLLDAGALAERAADALAVRWRREGELSASEARVLALLLDRGALPGTVLCGAAREGDEVLAERMLAARAPVDAACDAGSPLFVAARAGQNELAARLVRAGADRGAVGADDRTLFEEPGADAAALLAAAPVDARTEAALVVAWARGSVGPELVEGLPYVAAAGQDATVGVLARADAATFVDAYAALGSEALGALLAGPLRAAASGSTWTWGACDLVGGASPQAAAAWFGGPLGVTEREGPAVVRGGEGGRAGFLRVGLGRSALAWLDVPSACDPHGGAVVGLPRAAVRVGLGVPEVASPALDVWPADHLDAWGDRAPWYVVEYREGVAVATRVEWRRW